MTEATVEVSAEKIKQWKDQYKYIYKINLADKDYYIRTLDRTDYIDILSIQAREPIKFDHDVEVVKKCLISDFDPEELIKKAGIATVIAEKIMLASGFEVSDIEEV